MTLELANADQPQHVMGWVRRGVDEALKARFSSSTAHARAQQSVRARCSFHLLAPLVESYFFGERAALLRAGVAERAPVYRVGADVEDFATDDAAFMPEVRARNAQKLADGIAWWDEARHPKRYLEFLVASSSAPATGFYDELRGGREALETLDWRAAVAGGGAFARALFQDIADGLAVVNPLGDGSPSPHTYPAKAVNRATLTLRNG